MEKSDLIGIIQTIWNFFLAGISFLILWQTLLLENKTDVQLLTEKKKINEKIKKMKKVRNILFCIFIPGYLILAIYLLYLFIN